MPEGFIKYMLLCCWLCISCSARSQDLAFVRYTTGNGLPSNTVYSIYRDHNGLLWFGTDKGIATYNGLSFKTYTTADGLPDNEIFFFQQDYEGRLWMSTLNGALCYYKDGKFYNPENTPGLRIPVRLSNVNYILNEKDSSVSIGFYKYAVIVNVYKGRAKLIDFSAEASYIPYEDIISVKKLRPDLYQLYTPENILLADSSGHILTAEKYKNNNTYAYSVAQHQEYLLNPQGIYNVEQQLLLATNNKNITARTCRIYADSNDFFITTFAGLFINNSIHTLQDIKTTAVTQDGGGNYWISTLNNGAYMLSHNYHDIHEYKNVYRGTVKFAYADRGRVYFTTSDNNFYRFENGAATCLYNYAATHRDEKRPNQPAYITCNGRYYAFYNQRNYVTGNITDPHVAVKYIYPTTISNDIKNIYAAGRYIYLAAANQLDAVSYTNGNFSSERLLESDRWHRICAIKTTDTAQLYFSADDSMFRIGANRKILYQPQFGNISYRWGNMYGKYFVGCTVRNQLRISCLSNGKVYTHIPEKQDCIWNGSIQLDSSHVLLITNNLYRMLTLLPADSTPSFRLQVIENPFIPAAADCIAADSSGIYFFRDGNIISTSMEQLISKPGRPHVYFTSLKTAGNVYKVQPEIRIPYHAARNISVSFSTVAVNAKGLMFEYAVSKDDSGSWRSIETPEINMLAMDYGTYRVKVRAVSLSGDPGMPATFLLIVARPFWATWWFVLMAGIASVGFIGMAVFAFARYRYRKRERQQQDKIKFLKSEYKALSALMNPHFIFNSLNNIQAFINSNDKAAAVRYLNIFSSLVRQNMHNISRELIPLQKEIDLVVNYLKLEKLRFDDWLNFSINIEEDLELDIIKVPPLLLQPLVENAIKHGLLPAKMKEGMLILNVYERENNIHVEVTDNGAGLGRIAADKGSHESFGLSNIRSRIEQLRGIYGKDIEFSIKELYDEHGSVAGTMAVLIIKT